MLGLCIGDAEMDLGLDSFSYYMHWRYGGQTIDQLLDRVSAMALRRCKSISMGRGIGH